MNLNLRKTRRQTRVALVKYANRIRLLDAKMPGSGVWGSTAVDLARTIPV
jgi:hypothetical protein